MKTPETLSKLVGDIYDAALDATLWPHTLGQIRDFVAGYSASIFEKNAISRTGNILHQDGRIDERYVKLYFERYVRLDPCTIGQFLAGIGEPTTTTELIACDELLKSRFYKEWVRPQGLGELATAVLEKSLNTAVIFGVFRRERDGLFDDEMRSRVRLVAPHLRRAVLVGRSIDLKTTAVARFADALDSLSAGMFLVDAAGTMVHANSSGRAMLASGQILRAVGGRLTANNSGSDRALQESLAAASNGDRAIGIKGISQPLAAHSTLASYVAHVMPLTSGGRRLAAKRYAATAVVFVHEQQLQPSSVSEIIADHYKLTPSELRVLLTIAQVGGIHETTEALGVTENTVKTHLGRVFQKTGTKRQADLVRLVAGYSSPLFP
jgi:DNA-binding CsgD family transcriptional regulator/PAS domain-containing protein